MNADCEKAFWVTGPGRGEIREQRELGEGELLVRTRYSGISRGTESLVFRGQVPASQFDRMRAPFQEGAFPAPVKYGYSSVGIVEAGSESLRGRSVFCLYPHQTRYRIPLDAAHPLPDGVPERRALLAANLETAINAVWDGAPRVGDSVAVVGAGAVGCLVAWLVGAMPGCDVRLVDVNTSRADTAAALGVRFETPQRAAGEADLVFHASGSESGLATSLALAGFEARVVELSWYGSKAVSVCFGEAFHSQRLSLLSSQVGHVSPARRARYSRSRRLRLALSMLTDPKLDVLISGQSQFLDLPDVMARLSAPDTDALCHCIDYA